MQSASIVCEGGAADGRVVEVVVGLGLPRMVVLVDGAAYVRAAQPPRHGRPWVYQALRGTARVQPSPAGAVRR